MFHLLFFRHFQFRFMALQTKRNREYFVHDGFKYVFDKGSKKDETVSFWRCEFKDTKDEDGNKTSCPVRIHVRDGEVINQLHVHTHESNPASIEVTRIRNDIKRRAVETQEVRYFFNNKIKCLVTKSGNQPNYCWSITSRIGTTSKSKCNVTSYSTNSQANQPSST